MNRGKNRHGLVTFSRILLAFLAISLLCWGVTYFVDITEAQTFTVTQAGVQKYTLTINKSGTGSGSVSTNPSGTSFNAGTVVTLTATPDANSTFSGWSGGYTGSSTTCTVTMNSNMSVTATFTLKTYTITASAGANGSISPSGTVTVNSGANQTFTISPNNGYSIGDVKVDGGSVGKVSSYTFSNVTGNRSIEASFSANTPNSYTLTITKSGTGSGEVTINPSGTNFNAGTVVTLMAASDSNSIFSGWWGGGSGTSPTCTVTMNSDITVTAAFALKYYTITAQSNANGSISPSGTVTVNHGASQTFTITPNNGYIGDVEVDGSSVGKISSYTFSNVTGNHSIETSFGALGQEQLPSGMVHLDFEEGKGTNALDSSGNNNHGTIYGAIYTANSAINSYALSFNGNNDYVAVKNNGSLEPIKFSEFSIALWVRHMKDTSSAYGGIIKGPYGDGYSKGFRILDHTNKPLVQINFGDSEPIRIEGEPFKKGDWCHIVFTYDHQNIKLYQNGKLIQTIPETRNIYWDIYDVDLHIGLAQWYFRGAIDNVIIYNDVLSPSQAQQLFSQKRHKR